MTRTTRNILSASTAAFGVLSLIYLEAVATVRTVDALTASALITGFAAAGVMRWYLFYEGQTLREVDDRAARIAFRWSVGLSIFVMVYAVTLYATGEIDWRTLTVFLLVVSTLSVVEWVFGRRAGANVHPEVVRLKAHVAQSLTRSLVIVRALKAERKRNEELSFSLRCKINEIEELEESVQEGNELLQKFHNELTKFERNAGKWVRVSNVKLAIICPECGSLETFNQRTQQPACTGCGFELNNFLTTAK